MELVEKIRDMHAGIFCRMMGKKDIPEEVARRYFELKRLTDKVDGHLTVGDLARCLLDSGYKPEILKPKASVKSPKELEEVTGGDFLPKDTEVTVFVNNEITEGVIVKAKKGSETGVVYDVKIESGIVEVSEADLEVKDE